MIRVLPDGTLLDGLDTYGAAEWKGGKCASVSVLRSSDGGESWTIQAVTAPSNPTDAYFASVP